MHGDFQFCSKFNLYSFILLRESLRLVGTLLSASFFNTFYFILAYQVAVVVKNSSASIGDVRDTGLSPGSGKTTGGEHGLPLQYSCLKNPMDREAWRAIVHEVAKNQTLLKRPRVHAHIANCYVVIVVVSDAQQSNSAIHIHVSILPQTLLPSRLPHNIEQCSLCYITGPCLLSILSIVVCTHQSHIPYYPFYPPFPLTILNLFYTSVNLFLFCK